MAELTNLTDRISHLRDRKGGSAIVRSNPDRPPRRKPSARAAGRPNTSRKFPTDFFSLFVYTLGAVALGTQFFLLFWLDFI